MTLADIARGFAVLAVCGSFTFACVKVGIAAGGIRENLRGLITQVKALSDRLGTFKEQTDMRLADHGEQIAALKALQAAHFRLRNDD